MKVALLCSGLGNVKRGHEVFARTLFEMLHGTSIDMTLFKGGGEIAPNEIIVPNIPRHSAALCGIHVAAADKWVESIRQTERERIEAVTFAYGAIPDLLHGDFDVIHCLEQEVCEIVYRERHLFRKLPRILFSNGGALPKHLLPRCDAVQEYTSYNYRFSARAKAFVIPHVVDLSIFHPGIQSDYRERRGIPEDAFVVVSVGKVTRGHKRMDYVIREVASIPDAYLVVVGEEAGDTSELIALGKKLMGERAIFDKLPHERLPSAYAAGNVFVLGSLFETFGIVFIEAMAMGLPIICTNHSNQREIVKEGIFVDMGAQGALSTALGRIDRVGLKELGQRSRRIAEQYYGADCVRDEYVRQYENLKALDVRLPQVSLSKRIGANVRNAIRYVEHRVLGRAE